MCIAAGMTSTFDVGLDVNVGLTGSQTYLLLTSKIEHSEIEPEPVKMWGIYRQRLSSLLSVLQPNPGWYLMMRFHKDGESQVRHALIMCQKHIEADGGRILGLARPSGVSPLKECA